MGLAAGHLRCARFERRLIVSIDPGHGGENHGTNRNLIEEHWVLAVGLKLARWVNALDWDVRAITTRQADVSVSLTERAEIAARRDARLAISLHVNHYTNPLTAGTMVFYTNEGGWFAYEVADAIAKAAPKNLRRKNPVATLADDRWQRVQNVLKPYRTSAVLVECGFASNQKDYEELGRPEVQDSICIAIMAGISRGRELITPYVSGLTQ